MAINNPFKITYGSRSVGGSSDTYQLHGPYAVEKTFTSLNVAFDVVVVARTYAELQAVSEDLEDDFRKRDQTLVIELDNVDNAGASKWTYTESNGFLNVEASASKTGDDQTDRGFSRSYTCTVSGELEADDNDGLSELQVDVSIDASRRKVVAFQGTYTALSGTDAVAQYQSDFDTEAATFLTAVDSGATFELIDELYSMDRHLSSGTPFTHVCNFSRQYVELLANQTASALDATDIRDHHILFTDQRQHPGDGAPGIYRLQRVAASYDCAVDVDQATDLQSVYENQVKPHITALFQTTFSPQQFAVEDRRVSYDETAKRISSVASFVYQAQGGDDILEMRETTTTRELPRLDPTYTHSGGEFSAYIDAGWTVKERETSRESLILGDFAPLAAEGGPGQPPGQVTLPPVGVDAQAGIAGGGGAWHIVSQESSSTPMWIGDPSEEQIQVTQVSETVVKQFFVPPGS